MSLQATERFISPYEDAAPAGAEGWQDLYPYYLTFREERREIEDAKFWFADLAHWPRVFKPFSSRARITSRDSNPNSVSIDRMQSNPPERVTKLSGS